MAVAGFATFLPFAILCMVLSVVIGRRVGGAVGRLLPLAMLARIVGSTARYEVLERFYNGVGDAKRYMGYGIIHSPDVWSFDFTFLLDGNRHWWGTRFLENLTAFVVALVGQNIRSGFLAFSLFALAGAALTAVAFRNAGHDERRYAAWVLLWPSLCFWPSSIGKDAVMLLGIGLCVYGYVGRDDRLKLGPLLVGVLILTCIRPHIATLVAFALIAAETLRKGVGGGRGWWKRFVLVGIGLAAAMIGLSQFGLEISDLEGIQEKFEAGAARTLKGGSAIETSAGLSAIPMALVNTLLRPFPWEAHHVFALFASLEVWAFWIYVIVRRRYLRLALANWRRDRFVRFGVPIGLLLAFFYGLAMSNLGIIARQRVVILPFLFIFVALHKQSEEAKSPPASSPAPVSA